MGDKYFFLFLIWGGSNFLSTHHYLNSFAPFIEMDLQYFAPLFMFMRQNQKGEVDDSSADNF
jgi:hypothetical protein